MNCENCGGNADEKWNFCPKCGNEIRRKSFFEYGVADLFADVANNLARKLLYEMQPGASKNAGGFSVKIMQGMAPGAGQNREYSDSGIEGRKPAELSAKVRPQPRVTIEPKANFSKLPGKLLVEVEAPGVKSLDDVDVLELGTSVEVRAYSGDKLYFKIISIPKKAAVVSKKVEDGKVVLVMGG